MRTSLSGAVCGMIGCDLSSTAARTPANRFMELNWRFFIFICQTRTEMINNHRIIVKQGIFI